MTLAQEEAETLARDHVGTEHLLLGLLREGTGLAARVLGSLDITAERVRAHVVHTVGSGDEDASGEEVAAGQMPFSPRAKRVLERALREALALGRNGIGSEHILLGLLREDETVLLDLGVEVERVRANLYRELGRFIL